jgi:hypothetical protein
VRPSALAASRREDAGKKRSAAVVRGRSRAWPVIVGEEEGRRLRGEEEGQQLSSSSGKKRGGSTFIVVGFV